MWKSFLQWFKGEQEPAPQPAEPEPLRVSAPVRFGREGAIVEHSDTWIFVSNWAQQELDRARERNDSHKRDAIQTAALRGRIEVLKDLLQLPTPKERRRSTEQDE